MERLVIYDPQTLKVPTAAQPAGRAAGDKQEHVAPVAALPEERAAAGDDAERLVIYDPQALKLPAAAQPEERAAGHEQVQTTPAAAHPEGRADALSERLVIYNPQALKVPALELPAERAADEELMEPSAERVIGEELNIPAAVLPEERAAEEQEAHDAPPTALPDGRVVCDLQVSLTPVPPTDEDVAASDYPQVPEVPELAAPEARGVSDLQEQETPAAATEEDLAATTHLQAEEVPGPTEIVECPDVSQVEIMGQVSSLVAGDPAVPVGALAEKGVMGELLSTPPVLYHGNVYHPSVLWQLAEETYHAVIREVAKPKIGRDLFSALNPAVYQTGSVETDQENGDDEEDATSAGLQQKQEPRPRWSNGPTVMRRMMNLRAMDVFDRGRRLPTLCW